MANQHTTLMDLRDALRHAAADFSEIVECLNGLDGGGEDDFIAQAATRARQGLEAVDRVLREWTNG